MTSDPGTCSDSLLRLCASAWDSEKVSGVHMAWRLPGPPRKGVERHAAPERTAEPSEFYTLCCAVRGRLGLQSQRPAVGGHRKQSRLSAGWPGQAPRPLHMYVRHRPHSGWVATREPGVGRDHLAHGSAGQGGSRLPEISKL